MKYVLRAWGQLKRGFEVWALCEMCFQGMGEVEKVFEVWALCEICFEGMGAVEKGVGGTGIG